MFNQPSDVFKLPSNVGLHQGQSLVDHFQSFINYFNFQASLYADRICFRYYTNGVLKSLTYQEVDLITTNLACDLKKDVSDTATVSYINDHGIDYAIFTLVIMKLQLTLFTISPRNSKAAIVDLVQKVDSNCILCSPKYESTAKAAALELPNVKVLSLASLNYEELRQVPLNRDHNQILKYDVWDKDISKPALIIHSSGSTSFPKPFFLSNRYLLNVMRVLDLTTNQREGAPNVTGKDVFVSILPVFHIAGFFMCFSIMNYGSSTVFLEKSPPSIEDIVSVISQNKVTIIPTAPIIYEQIKKHVDATKDLSAFEQVKYAFFGSASMNKEIGIWYREHNINVQNIYGLTEAGPFLTSSNDPTKENWLSLAPFDYFDYIEFEPEDPEDPDIVHLHIKPGCPALANNANNSSDGGYDTNDLFKKDPDHPGYYIYLGRRDDTLILENGEKVNPIPMEQTICENPMIKHAAVLGHNRQCSSALVEVNVSYAMNYAPEQVIESVQNSVKQANTECPSHSVLFPEMVKILPFKKSLPTTDKGTVEHKLVVMEYQDVLDKMYKDFLNKTSGA